MTPLTSRGDRRQGLRALVLGGGGILGAAYEVGVLAGLEGKFGQGAVYRSFDVFVGTSAGSFVAALVGQGVPPERIFRAFIERDESIYVRPEDVYRMDWARLARGAAGLGSFVARLAWRGVRAGRIPPLLDVVTSALDRIPAGLLRIDPLERHLRRVFDALGVRDAFRDLEKPILIPAVDLDRAERRVFGESPETDPPISLAVAASSAIPRLFGPVRVGSRHFVDGGVMGAHLDVAIGHGASSIVFVNPVVASCEGGEVPTPGGHARVCRAVSGSGMGSMLDQCSKLEHEVAIRSAIAAAGAVPGVELVSIQPGRESMFSQTAMDHSAHAEVLQRGRASVDALGETDASWIARLLGATAAEAA